MDPQLVAQLKQTIYIASVTGADTKTGEPTYGTPVKHMARVSYTPQRIVSAEGVETVSTAQVAIEGEIAITDRIWLPGANQTVANDARYPLKVANPANERGGHDFGRAWL